MGKQTEIEWCDATWNPWYGCRKVSPGCKLCYAERDMTRYGREFGAVQRAKTTFRDPLKWKEPKRIFTCSWSDWFIKEADPWRDEAWEIIRQTPQHTYLILTKRAERIVTFDREKENWLSSRLPWGQDDTEWSNVWVGVSGETATLAEQRLDLLATIPFVQQFLSYEPALESIRDVDLSLATWVIVGGESGTRMRAREFKIEWAYETLAECRELGIPCFIKQLGTNPTFEGRRVALRDPKGGDMSEWPEGLRVREWPEVQR